MLDHVISHALPVAATVLPLPAHATAPRHALEPHPAFPHDPGDDDTGARQSASEDHFGYPLYGTEAAREFLDRLDAELGPRPGAARHALFTRDTARRADYWSGPWEPLIRVYVEMLRSGYPVDARHFQGAVIASFREHSADDARHIERWLGHADTFCRRATHLTASVHVAVDENTRPFAEAEVADQIERGLRLLYRDNAIPPTLTTTEAVLAKAAAERLQRIAAINAFYEGALAGDGISGLPPRKERTTYQLLDGRLVFKDAATALEMAPRAVRLRTWVGFSPFNAILHGPISFPGLRASSVEYTVPTTDPFVWNYPDSTYHKVSYDPGDGDTAADKFRLGDGPWQRFSKITTPELELLKAGWYVKLHAAAETIRG